MGGCLSISLPCDQVVNQFSQWLCVRGSYIHNLEKNLAALKMAMGWLKVVEEDVQRRVNREEFTGRQQRLSRVQVWLNSVIIIQIQFEELLSTKEVELQRLYLCGFCSKDLKLSYRYGKKVILMLREVETLTSQGKFDAVTEATPMSVVEEMPIQPTIIGQEQLFQKAWNRLMEDGSGILGLYGMGGVGKTTLLSNINNKFSVIRDRFDIVIWVVVSKNATVGQIQRDIGEKVGLVGVDWGEKNEIKRAIDIHNVLRRQKFVLLLDDIWEKVSLKAVGVPYPSRENGSKVAFTTRSRDVCGRMGVDDPMEVRCLQPEESWDLFQRTVGKNTLGISHPDIPDLARKVTKKCRGLPLALKVIGETMASKSTVREWSHAVDVLTSSATEFSGMEDEILPVLKYSYDSLNGKQVKACFLYCSLFPEDHCIDKEGLVDYWICEGLIDEKKGRERTLNQGYEIIGTLVRACLLLEGRTKSNVKMHDVVREMALWISSDLGKQKEKWIVQAGVGLCEVPRVVDWSNVRKMSLMKNEIEEISESHECVQLTTLFLQKNQMVKISAEFFRCMPHLVVLNLSENYFLAELPEEISALASLRYLDLSYTCLDQLPAGLWELKKLIHLCLEHMSMLGSISGISNLWNLKTLGLRNSKLLVDMSLVNELKLLKHLQVVTIDVSSSLVVEPLLCSHRLMESMREVDFKYLEEKSVRVLTLPTIVNLRGLSIKKCGMREIKIERTTSSSSSWNRSPTTPPCFPNLSRVFITKCHGLKDLTWLMFAPNLAFLEVGFSKQLEYIISKEKADDEHSATVVPFRRLETLHLFDLRRLKSIYWNVLPFPSLKVICVEKCQILRKLPLNSESGVLNEEVVINYGERDWIERVEWEDQATKLRFLPSCRWRWISST